MTELEQNTPEEDFIEIDIGYDSSEQLDDIEIVVSDTENTQTDHLSYRKTFDSSDTKHADVSVLSVRPLKKGFIAKVRVDSGTLFPGDTWAVGFKSGKIQKLLDERGKKIKYADAPMVVEFLGLGESPKEGDTLFTEATKKTHMSQKTKNRVSNTIIHIVLVIMAFVWILPFIGILLESFRVESTWPTGYIIPHKWGFDNYVRLFTQTNFPRWFGNTLAMGLATSVVQTIFAVSVAYALSRNRFKGRKFLMNVMLIFGMFPGFLTLILLYTWMHDWNLTNANAPWGLIIIYVASSGMGYYIAKGFFDTISHSLDEAAQIDGATKFQVFYKVILPLSKPIIIYTILMGFMAPWGDFVMASFMANNTNVGYNVAAGLQWLLTDSMKYEWYTTFCAGGVVVAVPITVLFLLLKKYYVAGVTGGAVKG